MTANYQFKRVQKKGAGYEDSEGEYDGINGKV